MTILILQDSDVARKLPQYVVEVKNKIGRPYLYLMKYRGTPRAEKAVRLPDDPRSEDFWKQYAALMQLAPAPKRLNAVRALDEAWGGALAPGEDGTFDETKASPEWRQLGEKTKIDWRRYRRWIVDAWGDLEVKGIEPKHVLALRDTYAEMPASANNLLRCLSSMMMWSVPRGWRADNPCREVKRLKGGDGYEPWPWTVINASRKALAPYLWWAVALALYTGQRLGDVLAMKWSDIESGAIWVVQEKTGKRLLIPIHRDLQAVLDAIPKTAVTILTNSDGLPWQSGFQATWRKKKPAATKGLVFHGLRKSAVVTLLEVGCSTAEVASITGQTMQMVEHYAKQVNQKKLAAAAILRWENASATRTANTDCKHGLPNTS